MTQRKISEHIFLFPFAWSVPTHRKANNFKPQQNLKSDIFWTIDGWKRQDFNIDNYKEYNEFVYFYKPVRNVLYEKIKDAEITKVYINSLVGPNSYCEVQINDKIYKLNIFKIGLRVFKSGIGILSIYLDNYTYLDLEDVKNINLLSECVYPLELPIKYHPTKITFYLENNTIYEDRTLTDYKVNAGKISPFIMKLLGKNFVQEKKLWGIYIEPLIGSKMVTLCLFNDDEYLKKVKLNNSILNKETIKEIYTSSDTDRFYYVTAFSLFCVSTINVDSKVYDQMMHLLLIQKTTLLNFSNQIASISLLPETELVIAIQDLYKIYIQFINQMYFNEVTEDARGRWLYSKISTLLNIQQEIQQLDFEMKEVHEYAELINREQSKIKVELFAFIGVALVVPTFVTGFFGMNIMSEELVTWWQHDNTKLWLNTYALFPILLISCIYTWRIQKIWARIIIQSILIISAIISLFIIFNYGCGSP
ncbi:hypothetical protein AN639_03280 [Candidatus Epulonipiscium fishelsonii]|uniref:Uncharacterized protein n=1 Tax=Candidatus Epulonipiscium fishelsonii TaxID=77094 RepID=A0ACC8XGS9_9FIRM|nr:hypothetical protein AN639_03280 [Epulopiscium sp. SCG-B05WGA-EpuloA1]ONI42639.1 hypothetical protein AN396_13735 [Epulopiscium sp. SCG-B11WGA-EpuloA1]ONI47261.1 hypothetical protein AN644_00995 [Epulopiscium sp. SCG-C06WGA-EpuloA1]